MALGFSLLNWLVSKGESFVQTDLDITIYRRFCGLISIVFQIITFDYRNRKFDKGLRVADA